MSVRLFFGLRRFSAALVFDFSREKLQNKAAEKRRSPEKAVEALLHEWVEERVLGANPFDVEALAANLIRDQYQGGPTVLTAISGVEIACWDLIGKAQGQPIYQLLGGKARERLPAYANG